MTRGRSVRTAAGTLALLVALAPVPGHAAGSEAEAKQTAAASNCKPGKIEVTRQIPGGNGELIYKVTCTDYPNMFVLVRCRQRLCTLLR
jgi:hypothetical protein